MKSSRTRTSQQNGVVEWKNRIVEEMDRTMLNDSKLSDIFWVQVVHRTIHILNRGLLRNKSVETPYGIWKGRPTNVKNFWFFGSKCYIKREDNKSENLTLKWMKAYLLDTHGIVKHTNVTTSELEGYWKTSM